MNEIFLRCKYIISGEKCNKIIKDGSILIEDNKIIAVGKYEKVKTLLSGHDQINRLQHVAIPSLVNSHTHLPETLLRGICDNQKLKNWLYDFIWPFEAKLSKTDTYFGALLGCLELIESGISGFIDQYFYASSIENAVEEAGIRALICPSVFDNTPESGDLDKTWKSVQKFLLSKRNSKNGLIKYGIGPHAPYSVPKEYLLDIIDFASRHSLPVHIHLSETLHEVKESLIKYDLSPIEYIHKIGLTDLKILGAHCVHTNEKDCKIMQTTDFTVLHNPQSNLKMASGIAPIHKYAKTGIKIALGTDGSASNNDLGILEEMNIAAVLQKYLANDPTVMNNAYTLSLGTISGMRTLGVNTVGLSEGSPADITILSLENSHSWPQNNPLSNIIYSSSSSDTSDLIVNGKFVYFNKKHQTLDKHKILDKCSSISQSILSEMGK